MQKYSFNYQYTFSFLQSPYSLCMFLFMNVCFSCSFALLVASPKSSYERVREPGLYRSLCINLCSAHMAVHHRAVAFSFTYALTIAVSFLSCRCLSARISASIASLIASLQALWQISVRSAPEKPSVIRDRYARSTSWDEHKKNHTVRGWFHVEMHVYMCVFEWP